MLMLTAQQLVAEAGMAVGELPIGAVVALGDEIVGSSFTRERTEGRRLVHADLLALTQADRALGWRARDHPLRLAVNLEPCLMCLGAAMTLGVSEVYYALDSPGDGGAWVAAGWRDSAVAPWFAAPVLVGGIHADRSRALFGRYADSRPDSGMGRWARTLADPPLDQADA